jgi:hypothetical protein
MVWLDILLCKSECIPHLEQHWANVHLDKNEQYFPLRALVQYPSSGALALPGHPQDCGSVASFRRQSLRGAFQCRALERDVTRAVPMF